MGLLRSEAMKYGMLVVPVQEARRYIDVIGRDIKLQFQDMNAHDVRRPYVKYIQRIVEVERMIRAVSEDVLKIEGCEVVKHKVESFLQNDDAAYTLDEVEAAVQQIYKQFQQFNEKHVVLSSQRSQATEELRVVEAALASLQGTDVAVKPAAVESESFEVSARQPLVASEVIERRLSNLSGVVLKSDQARLARSLFRASRGNCFTDFIPINDKLIDPKTGQEVEKAAFFVYFQGTPGETSAMQAKLLKVCFAFNTNMYTWPASYEEAAQRENALKLTLKEKEAVLNGYQNFMKSEAQVLLKPARPDGNSKIEEWRLFCKKEKSIYNILNGCTGDLHLRVNVWYPAGEEDEINEVLARENKRLSQTASLIPDKGAAAQDPPTYIRTNEFTEAWQEVIDTYGIAKYQEANPALLSTITFPFTFGMMYGDIGHGFLLFLAGAWLVINSDWLKSRQMHTAAFARYVIFQLGLFAVFCGFMYGDLFSVGLPLFNSRWKCSDDGECVSTYDAKNEGGDGPYPFGVDWMWHGASNELLYMNSLKMKLSVLFGVLQMIVGLILRFGNAFFEKNKTDLVCECIPMMIFMLCFFGWMDFMILYKWVTPMPNPPNIINSLICMAMQSEDPNPLFAGASQLSTYLMLGTVLTVPVMLFPKPFILLYMHKQQQKPGLASGDEEEGPSHGGHGGHGEEFEFGEVFIHQIIETIEYVLGTVSHTASYLRIWALSLAHQQLSLVFFQKTIQNGLDPNWGVLAGSIVLFFLFGMWMIITLGVLLGMDVLECFLHTLRLHWVEFDSKFYKGGGYTFTPYQIRKILSEQN